MVVGTRVRRKSGSRGWVFHHRATVSSISTTNAADPVRVSDIKWSRACKLSHSVPWRQRSSQPLAKSNATDQTILRPSQPSKQLVTRDRKHVLSESHCIPSRGPDGPGRLVLGAASRR